MSKRVPLGNLVDAAPVERAGASKLPVLSMTRAGGLVPQTSVFKKVVASRELTGYKIVRPNQLVVGIHIDEGALGFSGPDQVGIVSPAYTLWNLRTPEAVHTPFLHRFIRSDQAVSYFVSKYRETAERRGKLTREQFLALDVPLPPLADQKRIAGILDAADALRAKRREALAQLDALLQATFLDLFGDPVTNPKGWKVGVVGDLLESANYGTSEKADEIEGAIPILRMNNITYSGEWDFTSLKYIDLDEKELDKYLVRKGQLLFNRTNSKELVGKTAVYRRDDPMAFAGYLVRGIVKPDADAEYVGAFMNTPQTKKYLQSKCKNIVGMANINAKEFQAIPMPKPPTELQRRFALIVGEVEKQKVAYRAHLAELDILFASLESRAFRGDL